MTANTDQDLACTALVERVAAGDQAALASLFSLEAGRLIAIARRIVRRRELAEEVVQEAFVTIWLKAPMFDRSRGSGRVWMAIMVRNKALNMLRDGQRLDFHEPDKLVELGDRNGDADRAYETLPEADDLKRCLGLLPPERRRSIVLAYVVGFSHGEIAAQLKAPVGTVKAWIRRGVIALQECMS